MAEAERITSVAKLAWSPGARFPRIQVIQQRQMAGAVSGTAEASWRGRRLDPPLVSHADETTAS